MKAPNYVAVLAILNAMLNRVATSLPQIEEATRGLLRDQVDPSLAVSFNGSNEPNL
jgi:hypothetical protein